MAALAAGATGVETNEPKSPLMSADGIGVTGLAPAGLPFVLLEKARTAAPRNLK